MNKKELSPVTDEEKITWLTGIGRDSFLTGYCSADTYFDTCCLLTAAVLRYRLSGKLEWCEIYESEEAIEDCNLADLDTFQLSFGEDGDYDEHHLIVHEGVMYQSWWKKTKWDSRKLVVSSLPARQLSVEELENLTGYKFTGPSHYIVSVP